MTQPIVESKVVESISELKQVVRTFKQANETIGLVPTMGALHEGHLHLVRASLQQTDRTIVSIFVNPTQFAAHEDLNKYPRPFARDLSLLEAEGRVIVFAPSVKQMYPDGFSTSIMPPVIAKTLEGEFRPEHFGGVATVVLKLLNLSQADRVFFGQKDFQQQLVVRRMIADLNVPVEMVVCPIVRDVDGLALSSRNQYLSAAERATALVLNRTLAFAEQQILNGQRDGFELAAEMRQALIDGGVTKIDYVAIADPETLATMDPIDLPAVLLVAAFVGRTRLIDNRLIVAS